MAGFDVYKISRENLRYYISEHCLFFLAVQCFIVVKEKQASN